MDIKDIVISIKKDLCTKRDANMHNEDAYWRGFRSGINVSLDKMVELQEYIINHETTYTPPNTKGKK